MYKSSLTKFKTQVKSDLRSSRVVEKRYFKISIVEQFIRLESADDSGHHIGILSNGDLKAAFATGTEMESHFEMCRRLMLSGLPYI